MIYLKVGHKILKETEKDNIISTFIGGKRFYAVIKSIKRIITKDLKDYPDIDIIINLKDIHTILGRFSINYLVKHREYNFIKGDNPYIVLFWHSIENYYTFHCVKGLESVLLHEYGHFKQWLNNDKLQHSKELKHKATGQVEIDLKNHLAYIN